MSFVLDHHLSLSYSPPLAKGINQIIHVLHDFHVSPQNFILAEAASRRI